ncbi:MAG TPA: DUF4390 domain-containing protein [Gammaproteobacteria bacterium]|nr:DUF4390 domain-containing protein [Gammaproteobacteria bacterium]
MMRIAPTFPSKPRAAVIALVCVLCLGALATSRADDNQPGFVIRTAFTELLNGVYCLNADVNLSMSNQAIDALENGVPLTVELQIEVIKHRSWLWNKTVATLTERYQISFHPLTRRFIVKNLNSGQQQSFVSYRDAITFLGQVNDLPVIDSSLLEPDTKYLIRMRAVLDIKDFPGPLQLIASLFKGWDLSSDWYAWVLTS